MRKDWFPSPEAYMAQLRGYSFLGGVQPFGSDQRPDARNPRVSRTGWYQPATAS